MPLVIAGSVPTLAPAALLTTVDLSGNRLSGPLPALPADMQSVDFSHNDFTGAIPASYGAMPQRISANRDDGPRAIYTC